jgi:hypothetical protein
MRSGQDMSVPMSVFYNDTWATNGDRYCKIWVPTSVSPAIREDKPDFFPVFDCLSPPIPVAWVGVGTLMGPDSDMRDLS